MGSILVNLPGSNDTSHAIPYYEAYVNQDCQLVSEASDNWHVLSDSCRAVNQLIDAINAPYTGSSNGERLTWLKRRQALLMQRATVVAQALKDLGSTDTVDHTATSIRSISGLVAGFTAVIPAIGPLIGLGIGIAGNVIGGIIDTTKEDTERKNDEIAAYKADYANLTSILDTTNQEIDRLNLVNYLLWGGLAALLVILLLKRRDT